MAPLPETLVSLLPRSLFQRSAGPETIASDLSNSAISPMGVQDLHRRADKGNVFEHGSGAAPADSFNNQGFLALFAILGAGMVLSSIWFFFWARNGGFKWRKDDWDDYKSTVLRRKGPDGRTLSNATKSTKLGGGSVVHGGSYGQSDIESSVGYTESSSGYTDKDEMREVHAGQGMRGGGKGNYTKRNKDRGDRNRDPELADYRNEKAARVGGINRQHDGHYFDYSNTEPSTTGPNKKEARKEKVRAEKERKAKDKATAVAQKKAAANAKAAEKAAVAEKKKAEKNAKKKKGNNSSSGISKPAPVVLAEPPQQPASSSPKRNSPPPAQQQRRSQPSAAYSFVTGEDDNQTVYTGVYTNPYSDYPQLPQNHNHSQNHNHNRTQSQTQSQTQSYTSSGSYYDAYRPRNENATRHSGSNPPSRTSSPRKPRVVSDVGGPDDVSDTGTKSYPCYIPGLSSAPSVGVSDSVSQVAGRRAAKSQGYRRGGRGRRDSLSDSD